MHSWVLTWASGNTQKFPSNRRGVALRGTAINKEYASSPVPSICHLQYGMYTRHIISTCNKKSLRKWYSCHCWDMLTIHMNLTHLRPPSSLFLDPCEERSAALASPSWGNLREILALRQGFKLPLPIKQFKSHQFYIIWRQRSVEPSSFCAMWIKGDS